MASLYVLSSVRRDARDDTRGRLDPDHAHVRGAARPGKKRHAAPDGPVRRRRALTE